MTLADGSRSNADTLDAIEDEFVTADDIRKRVVTGAAVDVLRGFAVRVVALLATVVLARLLTPRDFGLIAFGATVVAFSNFFADGGIGTALIRRAEAPSKLDLKALLAFQLGLNTVLAFGVAAVLLPFGELGSITTIMVAALPIAAFRAPGVILLERQLNYRPLALVELVEAVVYSVSAILLVVAGLGVWGMAWAYIVRALVGSGLLVYLVEPARLVPSPSWKRVRDLLGFGFKFQAVGFLQLLREQGINAAVALIAGVPTLGIWSVASRILQIPMLFLTSLWRVSFPGMSRLATVDEDLGPTLERTLASVAVVIGAILAPLVATASPLVEVLLGEQWSDAATVIPPASLNLMISGPISVALVGYLWAVGDASAVLRATIAGIVPLAVVLLSLLPVVGITAVGLAWLAAGLVESVVLARAARSRVRIDIVRPIAPPTLSATTGALVGWLVAAMLGATLLAIVAGAAAASVTYLFALSLWRRQQLLDTARLISRGMRGALSAGG